MQRSQRLSAILIHKRNRSHVRQNSDSKQPDQTARRSTVPGSIRRISNGPGTWHEVCNTGHRLTNCTSANSTLENVIAEGLRAGLLFDVSEIARDAGFAIPVAFTWRLQTEYIGAAALTDGGSVRRALDTLVGLRMATQERGDNPRIFTVDYDVPSTMGTATVRAKLIGWLIVETEDPMVLVGLMAEMKGGEGVEESEVVPSLTGNRTITTSNNRR